MNIYPLKGLNPISNFSASLVKDSFISSITSQQKKIFAVAAFAIGLLVISILAVRSKIWGLVKNLTNHETSKSNTNPPSSIDATSNNDEIAKAESEAKKILDHANAKAKKILDKADADAKAIMDQAESSAKKSGKNTNVNEEELTAQVKVEANKIKAPAEVDAQKNKDEVLTQANSIAKDTIAAAIAKAQIILDNKEVEAKKILEVANANANIIQEKAKKTMAEALQIKAKALQIKAEAIMIKQNAIDATKNAIDATKNVIDATKVVLQTKAIQDQLNNDVASIKKGLDVSDKADSTTKAAAVQDVSPLPKKYKVQIMGLTDYLVGECLDPQQAPYDIKKLCESSEFSIPDNVSKILNNLGEEISGSDNYRTFLAFDEDNGTILGVMNGEIGTNMLKIVNLAVKNDQALAAENIEQRLLIEVLNFAIIKKKQYVYICLRGKSNEPKMKFTEKKYIDKIAFHIAFAEKIDVFCKDDSLMKDIRTMFFLTKDFNFNYEEALKKF